MYCRKIILDTFKYAQTFARSNCMVMNNCLLNSKRNTFRMYSSQIHKIRKHNQKFYDQRSSTKTKLLAASVLSYLFEISGGKEEEEKDDVKQLEMTIKRSILLIQKGEFPKAERMLHIALRQAQTLQHYDGITYVYDVMANLAYRVKDYKKAEKLFVSVLQRLMSKGVSQDDLGVIHISLKMANMYSKMGDTERADIGFKFCLEHLQKHLLKDSENEDALKLLGIGSKWYATMLFSRARYTDALDYLTRAYDVSLKVNGEEHEVTANLLNDLGTTNYMMKEYDQAIEYLSQAIKIGKMFPDMVDIGFMYVNLGHALIEKGLYAEAKKSCSQGIHLAKLNSHDKSMVEAEKCLERIKNLTT